MTEPTGQQVFGTNFTQNATTLTISKADLQTAGLTPLASNTAESLIAAILLFAAKYLNSTNQETNPDIQVTISQSQYQTLVNRNNQNYRQVTLSVDLQSVDTGFSLDPDNY